MVCRVIADRVCSRPTALTTLKMLNDLELMFSKCCLFLAIISFMMLIVLTRLISFATSPLVRDLSSREDISSTPLSEY